MSPCILSKETGDSNVTLLKDGMTINLPCEQAAYGYLIGVDLISIYRVLCMYFCNLNARFTTIFLKISLIPHFLNFVGLEGKSSKVMEKPSCEEGANPTAGSSPRQNGSPRRRMLRHCEA